MAKKLSQLIELYQKNYVLDDSGGRIEHWVSLGKAWAHMMPYRCSYPFHKEAKNQSRGMAYEAILREDKRLFLTEKIVWNDRDHFLLHSPHQDEPGYVKVKVFSWGEGQ